MTAWRWPPADPPQHLGAVVHGPVLLSGAKDVAAGLRCVWAHPEGLWLPLVVQARGVHAEAAVRHSFDRTGAGDPPHADLGVGLRLVVGVGDRTGVAEASGGSSSGGDDDFTSEPHYWVGDLPQDGVLRVGVSWPEVGLPETQTTLRLEGLADLADRVVHLLPSDGDPGCARGSAVTSVPVVESWQHECCGERFAVGSRVAWGRAAGDPTPLLAVQGGGRPQWTQTLPVVEGLEAADGDDAVTAGAVAPTSRRRGGRRCLPAPARPCRASP